MNRIIDLTRTFDETVPGFSREQAKRLERDGWNASTFHLYSHAGTHMDAPVHVEVGDAGIDHIDPGRFVCNCHVIHLTGIKPGELITTDMMGSTGRNIRPGEGILLHTGWSRHMGDLEMFRNHLPRISRELAVWMKQKKVNLVGVEPPSVADVNNRRELLDIHAILLGADILVVEGLVNLDQIKNDRVQLIVLPLKVKNADGAPVRAIAIED